MRKALVIDWLDKYGGAERVVGTLEKVFRFDVSYTLVNTMEEEHLRKIFNTPEKDPKVTWLQLLRGKFRWLFFLFPFVVRTIKIDPGVRLIISSSHAVAKGIKKSHPSQLHISYFQARNFNYIWSDYSLYFGIFRFVLYPLIFLLRKVDVKQGQLPDYIIANSKFVRDWVKEKYGRESHVIYPPVDLSPFNLHTEKEDFYVVVGRLVYVKRFDLAIQAFNNSNRKLLVIGDGDQGGLLKKMAGPNIVFTGFLSSEEVAGYISRAKAFIQTGVEGFGIAPIEAQACGTPVIAFEAGGVCETVLGGKTGIFFKEQTVESLARALDQFESTTFNYATIRSHALQFSAERFEKEIAAYVNTKVTQSSHV